MSKKKHFKIDLPSEALPTRKTWLILKIINVFQLPFFGPRTDATSTFHSAPMLSANSKDKFTCITAELKRFGAKHLN